MEKLTKALVHSFAENICPEAAANESVPGRALHIRDFHFKDKRVSQLLVLLQELDDCSGGLEGLPELELSEIICSAIELSGFKDPIEARDVIATVLAAIKTPDPIPEISRSNSAPDPRN